MTADDGTPDETRGGTGADPDGGAAGQAARGTSAPSPGGEGDARWLLCAVAAGGALGALARYAAQRLAGAGTTGPTAFPWALLLVNAVGCALLGVVMAYLTEAAAHGRRPAVLLRPFLGVGLLGGFTSLSGAALDAALLLRAGAVGPAVGCLLGTLTAALVAVVAATTVTTTVLRRWWRRS
mgnify:CR=1 FL=1